MRGHQIAVIYVLSPGLTLHTTTVLRVLLALQESSARGFCFEPSGLAVDVAPTWTIPRCGEYGTKCRSIHDGRERLWRHHDLAGMTLHLRYRIRRVVGRSHGASGDCLDGLRLIGVDELSYRWHHKYVTVVVDHERGRVVWAAEGNNAATLKRFFEELGRDRCAQIEAVTIDFSAAYIKP